MASPQPTDAELLAELVKQVGKLNETVDKLAENDIKQTAEMKRLKKSDKKQSEIISYGLLMVIVSFLLTSGIVKDENYKDLLNGVSSVLVSGGIGLLGFKDRFKSNDETED